MELLIICPLAFIAGFVDAIAGGGGLISLPAFILAGLPVHNALATNKLMSTMGTTISTVRYALQGYMVKSFVAVGIACGLTGSCLGSNLALLTDDWALKAVMLVALPFIAYFVLRTKELDSFSETEIPRGRAIAITAAVAFAVGIYDGFYGPGTGTFLLLLLTALAHQDIRTAAGTTKAINLSTNVAALAVFFVNGAVLIPLGLIAGVFNIAGNFLGSRTFVKEGSRITRPIMLVVLTVFAAKLVFDLFIG
ncbi:MAG: TSUP family transporter [Coriobacteriia bacterium]|nr:TSUP family transporter [Coriobacteriia bacterium]